MPVSSNIPSKLSIPFLLFLRMEKNKDFFFKRYMDALWQITVPYGSKMHIPFTNYHLPNTETAAIIIMVLLLIITIIIIIIIKDRSSASIRMRHSHQFDYSAAIMRHRCVLFSATLAVKPSGLMPKGGPLFFSFFFIVFF